MSVSMGQMEKEVNSDGVWKADEGDKVADYATKQKEKKQAECKQDFKKWVRKKRIASKEAKKAAKKVEKEKVVKKELRQKASAEAYEKWMRLHNGKKYFSYKKKQEVSRAMS